MNQRRASLLACAALCLLMAVCSKKAPAPQLLVEIPAGFSGNFVLEMGVRSAAPLQQQRGAYVVTVPLTGRVQTSTFLQNPELRFHNSSEGTVWGISQSTVATGDGIAVGGKIEFFVGTQKQFEAEQNKRNKSLGVAPAHSFQS